MSQKLKNIFLTGGASAILALAIPASVLAAGVTVSNDTTMSLPCFSAATLTIVSGSTATSFTVDNSACTFTVTAASGDVFTVNASANVELNSTGAGNWSTTCQSGSSNTRMRYAPSVATETTIFTPANRSVSCGGSVVSAPSGGGGGGGVSISPPVASATNSTFALSATSIASDGTATATITITVKDTSNRVMVGVTPSLTSNRTEDKIVAETGKAATDSLGVAVYKISSTKEGISTITIKVDSSILPTKTLTFAIPTAEAPVVTKVETTKTGTTTTLSDGAVIERATSGTVTITVGTKKTTVADRDNVRSSKSTAGVFDLPSATIFRVRGQTIDLYADETIFWSYYPTCGKTWSATCLGLFSKLLPVHIGAAWPTQGAFFGYKSGTIISVKLGATTKYYAIADKVYQLTAATAAEKSAAIAARPIMTSVAFSYNNGDGGKVANTAAISSWGQ